MTTAYFALFGLPALIVVLAFAVYWISGRALHGGDKPR